MNLENNPNDQDESAEYAHVGEFLKAGRLLRRLSLEQVARITKVPRSALDKIENGDFSSLPADVFVRGFIKAFAACIEVDTKEALLLYSNSGMPAAPVVCYDAAEPAKSMVVSQRGTFSEPVVAASTSVAIEDRKKSAQPKSDASRRIFLPPIHMDESRRGGLTVAVIILVIVATLTMSYLLRRPSSSGNGFTWADDAPLNEAAHPINDSIFAAR